MLEGADLRGQIGTFVDDVVTGFVTGATQGFAEEWERALQKNGTSA